MRGRGQGRAAALLAALVMVAAACGAASESGGPDAAGGLRVVATTTVLADLARQIVAADGTVEALLPIGADPHDYQASAQQVAELLDADLVLANGLGLEEGLVDVLANVAADGGNVLEIGERVDPIPFGGGAGDDHDDDHDDGDDGDHDDHGAEDPHVWLDPVRMAEAGRIIAAELAAIDPTTDWPARAEVYAAEMLAVDAQIREILEAVPPGQRKLVTNHDSLGYFAARYDFYVVGAVIPGGATLADPSSADLAALVAAIEREAVPAIFVETTEPTDLADAVAAEIGADVAVVELYTGSLGAPGSGADSLPGMLLTNAMRIAAALAPSPAETP